MENRCDGDPADHQAADEQGSSRWPSHHGRRDQGQEQPNEGPADVEKGATSASVESCGSDEEIQGA